MAKLNSDGKSVTVVKGDTLSQIAVDYKSTIGSNLTLNQRIDRLVSLNNIKNRDIIIVGQVIKLTSDSSGGGGGSSPSSASTTSRARIDLFGLQANTDRTVYAEWYWSRENTDHYETKWEYRVGDSTWFIAGTSNVNEFQDIYTAPSHSTEVRFWVRPISKTHTVNNTETSYWTANWSTAVTYNFSNNPPTTPPVPSVTVEKYKLTAELENLDVNATSIQFQIVKDNSTVFNTGTAEIITNHASYSCNLEAGGEYKVRCRSCRDSSYSEWSNYSSNYSTIPSPPGSITTCRASSETSVYLEWETVSTAKTYELEYTTKKEYFDGSDKTTTIGNIEFNHYEKTGLETGEEYFFRVRSVNESGNSSWSDAVSVVIGKDPSAPTTWSSSTTVITGETLILYWIHNAEDGSSETYAELELYIDGRKETYTIKKSTDEEEKDKTSFYNIDTTEYPEGTHIEWRVRTAGITKAYGDWSVQRTVDVYAPATLQLSVTDVNGDMFDVLTQFPFYVSALAGPKTQAPIGYYLTVVSNEIYETVDHIGNKKMVNEGEQVYSKYFDITERLLVEMSAYNIDLENNIRYTITCVVSMNSGLTAEASYDFRVAWTDEQYEPNAEIGIDKENLSAYIRPYCEDENGGKVDGVLLSVYRREYDGSFVELCRDINNAKNTFITDPHPSLDYARYRIVAITESTGAVSYYDVPGYPIKEKAVVIQWNEDWSNFDVSSEDAISQPAWSGSILKLPYNIDVSDSNNPDVSLIKYIGRSHPVSYYGTQLGTTSSWNMEIDKSDKETLYALRRLAIWMGDVYVREPSGSGYWANINVSFSQKHCAVTIPVSIEITRVEGGV